MTFAMGEIPHAGSWQLPTPVPLPGKSHGQRNLVDYSPWGRKESDTTERLNWTELNRCIDQLNKIENPEINLPMDVHQLI